MLDPEFWTDTRIKRLTFVERLFFLGCVSAADDEGRLLGDPAFLRSRIFPYDEIPADEVRTIRDRVAEVVPGFVLYSDDGEEYVAFANWSDYQKPSHAKASDLPRPPFVHRSSEKGEEGPNGSVIGKDSIGKDRYKSRKSHQKKPSPYVEAARRGMEELEKRHA